MILTTARDPQLLRRLKDNLRRRNCRGIVPSRTEIESHMNDYCFHCSVRVSWTRGKFSLHKGTFDRIDNKGYHEISNIVTACFACNSMRNDMPIEEYHSFLKNLFADKGTQISFRADASVHRRNYTDKGHVLSLLEAQNGRCYLTGVAFELAGPRQFSVDRIDSSKGYTKDNVALCLKQVNFMKNAATISETLGHLEHLRTVFTSVPSDTFPSLCGERDTCDRPFPSCSSPLNCTSS